MSAADTVQAKTGTTLCRGQAASGRHWILWARQVLHRDG